MARNKVDETAEKLDFTHIVNVQGNEIIILPLDLVRMTTFIEENLDWQYWNTTEKIESSEEL